jgi:hypothetical protein
MDAEASSGQQVDLVLNALPEGEALKLAAARLKSLVRILSIPEIGTSMIDLIVRFTSLRF